MRHTQELKAFLYQLGNLIYCVWDGAGECTSCFFHWDLGKFFHEKVMFHVVPYTIART